MQAVYVQMIELLKERKVETEANAFIGYQPDENRF